MKNSDFQIAVEFRSRLEVIMPILDLRIFGSRARGDGKEDSDLDIFIKVVELNRAVREKIHYLAWEVGFKYNLVISTFVVTENQIQLGGVGASPLLLKVLTEGIVI